MTSIALLPIVTVGAVMLTAVVPALTVAAVVKTVVLATAVVPALRVAAVVVSVKVLVLVVGFAVVVVRGVGSIAVQQMSVIPLPSHFSVATTDGVAQLPVATHVHPC
jgi:hypothetical protein